MHLQAHTGGGVPDPHPGGLQAQPCGVSRPTQGWMVGIPACTVESTPLQQTATAAGGMHPTGMHSCSHFNFENGKFTFPGIIPCSGDVCPSIKEKF